MILQIFILVLSFPAGYLIAGMVRDELVLGRKWFILIIILSAITAVYSYLIKSYAISLTSSFALIISGISYIKSFDKNWTKI